MSEDNLGKTCSFDVCSNCKLLCCIDANPPLTTQREKTIENYLKNQKISLKSPFVHGEYSHPASDAEGVCVFFSKKTGKCIVHPVKPETCKAGPITFDINLKTRKVEWFLKKGEICALAQKLHDNKEALNVHFEAVEPELMHLICELDARSLKAILRIDEPQTIKFGEGILHKGVLQKLKNI